MQKNNKIQTAFLSFCGITLLGIISSASETKKTNIIFILADDLGYGDVSCLNEDGKIHTISYQPC